MNHSALERIELITSRANYQSSLTPMIFALRRQFISGNRYNELMIACICSILGLKHNW